ncbi:MAG: SAM-dependent methyltransferase [Thiotrichaceae bacterium IS1]|nr:MAG: SAM-dependent methyltransferase [Thiotrichaceae bacterium IS1]
MNDKFLSWEEAVLWLKKQPTQVELVKACFYDDPLIDAAKRYYASTEWQAIQKLIPSPPGKALDIGAGRGISSYALARDGWDTTALEPDGSQEVGAGAICLLATESGLKIKVVEEWGEQLPFEDNSFDLVHCRQVLHHAKDLQKLCREIGRVLKNSGIFIATREHVISHKEDLAVFLERHPLHKLYGGENAYLLEEYITAIGQGNIKLTHVFNPLQSDINTFPETLEGWKNRLARKFLLPFPKLIPNALLGLWGALMNSPGRLYTFVGKKSNYV